MLIVKMICLAIGTVLAVLFILLTMRGKKEDWRIEGSWVCHAADADVFDGFGSGQKDDIGLGYPAS